MVVAHIAELDIGIINAATGTLIRELTLDTTRTYQPTGRPVGGTPKTRTPEPLNGGSGASDVSRHHRERMTGIEPAFSAWEADVLPLNYIREEP